MGTHESPRRHGDPGIARAEARGSGGLHSLLKNSPFAIRIPHPSRYPGHPPLEAIVVTCPIPRATKQFGRRYEGRSAGERVNARVKVFWGADDGNITGDNATGSDFGSGIAPPAISLLATVKSKG